MDEKFTPSEDNDEMTSVRRKLGHIEDEMEDDYLQGTFPDPTLSRHKASEDPSFADEDVEIGIDKSGETKVHFLTMKEDVLENGFPVELEIDIQSPVADF